MKRPAIFFGVTFSVLLAGEMAGRDLKTTTGEVYHNFAVTKKEATGLRIAHDDGVGFVDFILLSDADKKEFGYDPAAYTAGQAEKIAAEKARQQALAAQLAAKKAAEKAFNEQPYTDRDYASRDYGQREIPPVVPNSNGVQVTVDTPDYSALDYGSNGTVIIYGAQPGAVGRARGFFLGNGGYVGPTIIRRR